MGARRRYTFSARNMRAASRLSPASLDGFDVEGMAMKLQPLLGPLLGMLMLMTGRAQAQTHVCGAGPGPGEVLVGEMPGGNGVAAEPLCDWVQGSGQASQAPHIPIAPPPPQILFYGAFAIDQKMHVSASWNHPSVDGAMKSAYDACLKGNGGGCRVISKKAFHNCGAVSADGAGLVYMVTDPICFGIAKKTMDWCKSQSKVGKCHMLTGSIVAGSSWDNNGEGANILNCGQMSLSDDQLTALSQ
jgi:hypothetical protein